MSIAEPLSERDQEVPDRPDRPARPTRRRDLADQLTEREREVLRLLVEKDHQSEIRITVETVKTHLMRISRKLFTISPREAIRARGSRESNAKRVVCSAAGLLTAASRLLPAGDRARYAEEYRSELWDLAQGGAGRLGQLWYALRQLRSVLPMSLALRSPRRRSAAP